MSASSKIEWTDATWNPVRGCTKVIPGCAHCYAETLAERFRGVPGHPYEFGFDLRLVPHKITEPITWSRPKMVFVNSMSDLFHESISDEFIEIVVRVMEAANWHIYQVLTKRSERLLKLLSTKLRFAAQLPHIWWGVSVENQRFGLPRIEHLRAASPAIAFLSVEPLLEHLGPIELEGLRWIIVGGESGPGARPMEKTWVLDLQEQCSKRRVPFFFKQWGGVQKGKTGRRLNGRTYDELPPITRSAPADSATRKQMIKRFQERLPEDDSSPHKQTA